MSTEKEIVDLALVALNSLRSVEIFELIWDETVKDANTLQWTEASSPRKWARPPKSLSGKDISAYDDVCDAKIFYRYIYFNVIDTVVNCIEDWFAQAGYQVSTNIEQLLF